MKNLLDKWDAKKGNQKQLNILTKNLDKVSKDHVKADKIHNDVFQEMDCLQCANCCKSIPPIISNRDVKRISKHLNKSTSEFKDQYVKLDSDGDQVINASPCPFLNLDNKCSIYSVRPAACREYPHSGEGQFYKNKSHHRRNMKYCPALMEIVSRLAEVK